MSKKVIFVVAHEGYQPVEYSAPKQILESVGFEVVTASDKADMAIAKDSSITPVDVILDDVRIEDYDGLFFIGGPGALRHLDNVVSYTLLKKWKETGKPYGAICISPRILAKAGVLRNKKATGWDEDNELALIFEKNGVDYVRESVVTDGDVVTADGPKAAQDFGREILHIM